MPPIRGRKADSNGGAGPGSRPNTVGMPARELNDFLDRLEEGSEGHEGVIKRTHARWPFRQSSLRLTLEHPGGSRAAFQVACRNLSRGGTGVLHSSYVHAGTQCALDLPRLDGQRESIPAKVVRCTHIHGLIHELGVRFQKPLQIGEYVQLDPLMGWSSFEKVDPEKLSGTIVVVTDSELDERIIGHYLSDSHLKIKFAKNAAEIEALERSAGEVALVDLAMEGSGDLFASLRERAVAPAMIAIGPDASMSTRMLLQEIGADGFVFKPLSSDRLLSVLADSLLGSDAVQIDPALAGDGSGELVKSCIEQLQGCATEIREAIVADDPMRCYGICQHIKAIALPLNLHPIVRLADQTGAAIAQSMNCAESGQRLQDLARACERVRASAAA